MHHSKKKYIYIYIISNLQIKYILLFILLSKFMALKKDHSNKRHLNIQTTDHLKIFIGAPYINMHYRILGCSLDYNNVLITWTYCYKNNTLNSALAISTKLRPCFRQLTSFHEESKLQPRCWANTRLVFCALYLSTIRAQSAIAEPLCNQ